MNMPIVRDEKDTQTDFAILAQRKVIDFDVSYYQARMQQVAQELITAATFFMTVGA